tara:strand:+ start:497 stop:676 length:180 start_codon:yes stop_codon:yes gene_type:complete
MHSQKFMQKFLRNLNESLGTFTEEVMTKPTPADREKAFLKWAAKNPQSFDVKPLSTPGK